MNFPLNKLPTCQVEIRTTDHIFTLNFFKEEAKRPGKKLHICAVDFQKAFPSINRELLIAEVKKLHLSDE